eukprot:g81460.t1
MDILSLLEKAFPDEKSQKGNVVFAPSPAAFDALSNGELWLRNVDKSALTRKQHAHLVQFFLRRILPTDGDVLLAQVAAQFVLSLLEHDSQDLLDVHNALMDQLSLAGSGGSTVSGTATLSAAVQAASKLAAPLAINEAKSSPSHKLIALACLAELSVRFGQQFLVSVSVTVDKLLKLALRDRAEGVRDEGLRILVRISRGPGLPSSLENMGEIYKAVPVAAKDRSPQVRIQVALLVDALVRDSKDAREVHTLLPTILRGCEDQDARVRLGFSNTLGSMLWTSVKLNAGKSSGESLGPDKNRPPSLGRAFKKTSGGPVRSIVEALELLGRHFSARSASADLRRSLAQALSCLFSLSCCPQRGRAAGDYVPKTGSDPAQVDIYLHSLLGYLDSSKGVSVGPDREEGRLMVACLQHALVAGVVASTDMSVVEEMCKAALRLVGSVSDLQTGAKRDQSKTHSLNALQLLLCIDVLSAVFHKLGPVLQTLKIIETALDPLQSLLRHPSPLIRRHLAEAFRQLCLASPSQMNTWMMVLNSVTQLELNELSTADAGDVLAELYYSVDGHVQALVAMTGAIAAVGSSSVPFQLVRSMLITVEGLVELPLIAPSAGRDSFEARLLIKESSWMLLTALVGLGSDWVGVKLTTVFAMLLKVLGKGKKNKNEKSEKGLDSTELRCQLVEKGKAIRVLRTLIHHFSQRMVMTSSGPSQTLQHTATLARVSLSLVIGTLKSHEKTELPTSLVEALTELKEGLFETYSALPALSFQPLWPELLHLATMELSSPRSQPGRAQMLEILNPREKCLLTLADDDKLALPDYPWLWFSASLTSEDGSYSSTPASVRLKKAHAAWESSSVRSVDSAIKLFGKLFARQKPETQVKLLEHFSKVVFQELGKLAKPSESGQDCAQHAALYNMSAALLSAVQTIGASPSRNSVSRKKITGLLQTAPSVLMMNTALQLLTVNLSACQLAAAETIGLLAAVQPELVPHVFEKLKASLMGHSVPVASAVLAMACVMVKSDVARAKYLGWTVQTLSTLAVKCKTAVSRLWFLHSLDIIMRSFSASSPPSSFVEHGASLFSAICTILRADIYVTGPVEAAGASALSALISFITPDQMPVDLRNSILNLLRYFLRLREKKTLQTSTDRLEREAASQLNKAVLQILFYSNELQLKVDGWQLLEEASTAADLSLAAVVLELAERWTLEDPKRARAKRAPLLLLELLDTNLRHCMNERHGDLDDDFEFLLLSVIEALNRMTELYIGLDVQNAAQTLQGREPSVAKGEQEDPMAWMSNRWWLLDGLKRAIVGQVRLQSDQQLLAHGLLKTANIKSVRKTKAEIAEDDEQPDEEGGGEEEVYSVADSSRGEGSDSSMVGSRPRWELSWRAKLVALKALQQILKLTHEASKGLFLPHEWDARWLRKRPDRGLGTFLTSQLPDLVTVANYAAQHPLTALKEAGEELLSCVMHVFANTEDPDPANVEPCLMLQLFQPHLESGLKQGFDHFLPRPVEAALFSLVPYLSGAIISPEGWDSTSKRFLPLILRPLTDPSSLERTGILGNFNESVTTSYLLAHLGCLCLLRASTHEDFLRHSRSELKVEVPAAVEKLQAAARKRLRQSLLEHEDLALDLLHRGLADYGALLALTRRQLMDHKTARFFSGSQATGLKEAFMRHLHWLLPLWAQSLRVYADKQADKEKALCDGQRLVLAVTVHTLTYANKIRSRQQHAASTASLFGFGALDHTLLIEACVQTLRILLSGPSFLESFPASALTELIPALSVLSSQRTHAIILPVLSALIGGIEKAHVNMASPQIGELMLRLLEWQAKALCFFLSKHKLSSLRLLQAKEDMWSSETTISMPDKLILLKVPSLLFAVVSLTHKARGSNSIGPEEARCYRSATVSLGVRLVFTCRHFQELCQAFTPVLAQLLLQASWTDRCADKELLLGLVKPVLQNHNLDGPSGVADGRPGLESLLTLLFLVMEADEQDGGTALAMALQLLESSRQQDQQMQIILLCSLRASLSLLFTHVRSSTGSLAIGAKRSVSFLFVRFFPTVSSLLARAEVPQPLLSPGLEAMGLFLQTATETELQTFGLVVTFLISLLRLERRGIEELLALIKTCPVLFQRNLAKLSPGLQLLLKESITQHQQQKSQPIKSTEVPSKGKKDGRAGKKHNRRKKVVLEFDSDDD